MVCHFSRDPAITVHYLDKEMELLIIVSANYNESFSDPDRVDDLIEMVSTFALIGV